MEATTWTREGHGRGIVMCSSSKQSKYAFDVINQMYSSWNTTLPVTIMHCNELTWYAQKLFKSDPRINVHDICGISRLSYKFQKKLRSFHCKASALYLSPYEETLLLDIDVIWFKKPDLLFDAEGYVSTGALFFRDRFVYQRRVQKRDGLFQREVMSLIEQQAEMSLVQSRVRYLSRTNLFFRHEVNRSLPALQHIQESSVVLLRKSNHLGMLSVMHRLLPTYQQGYGDKELYWIAATIAEEDYSFEPYLFATYGDCGSVLHFDPRRMEGTSAVADVFFMNAEYLLEKAKYAGDLMLPQMSRPVRVTEAMTYFDMGDILPITKYRCGGCTHMGCMPVPALVNNTLLKAQARRLSLEPSWLLWRQ